MTSPEPLPADSPFWEASNLLITPHVSGDTEEAGTVESNSSANLRLYLEGYPERTGNLVDLSAHR